MATVTLRPDATTLLPNPPWAVTGAGAAHIALNDNSDATYVAHDTSELNYILKIAFATSSIPALAQIRLVTFRYRLQFPSWVSTDNRLYAAIMRTINASGYEVTRQVDSLVGGSASIVTVVGTAQPTDPGGGGWSQVEIDQLEAQFWLAAGASGSSAFRLLELYADVLYNEAPVCVVTAPTEGGTVASTRPTIAWTYTDPENDAQERYRIKIFDSVAYGDAGFNVDASIPFWDSGEVYSELKSFDLPVDLTSGTSYRAYVRVSDAQSGGRYSNWDYNQFTVSVSPPAAPSITVAIMEASAMALVTIQGGDNLLTDNEASIETDATAWASQTNVNVTRSTAWFADTAASLQMSSVAAGDMEARTVRQGLTGIPVTPSKQYTIVGTWRAATVARQVSMGVAWYDAAGTIIGAAAYGTAVNDATGSDVVASLTATAPVNAAFMAVRTKVAATGGAAEIHRVDKIGVRPGTSTAWTRGGVAASVVFILEYSDNGGTSWAVHRTGAALIPNSVADQVATMEDYEIKPGVQRLYRARSMAVV